MSDVIREQKNRIISDVLDLNKKLKAIEYILDEAKRPENQVAIEIFDELLNLIYILLWESLVIHICWLYEKNWYIDKTGSRIEKKETRSLFWFLDEQNKSHPNNSVEYDRQKTDLINLETTIQKVRLVRNKWIAHRDKKAFENPNSFLSDVGLKIEDVKILVEKADEIAKTNFPVTDLSSHGIGRLFWAIDCVDYLPEKIEEIKSKQKLNK